MKFDLSEIIERVDNGEDWLNREYPDWRQSVNNRTLDMADPYYCVLTQASGVGYYLHVPALLERTQRAREKWAFNRGFDISRKIDQNNDQIGAYYNVLTGLWLVRLR